MPVKADREYRAFKPMEVRKDEQTDSYIVEGYASTFNDPYYMGEYEDIKYYEQIDARAFDDCDMTDVIFQYDHEGLVYARNKNGSLELSTDEHGLKVVANLGLTQQSRQMYEAIAAGLVDQMSFGFTVDADKYDKKSHTRTITKVRKLYDVSAVSIPANPGTDIKARNFFNGEIEKELKEIKEAQELEDRKASILAMLEA